MDVEQRKLLLELEGLKDQIEKRHYLNVHFRAFRLANDAWQEHIRANAHPTARKAGLPGAIADPHEGDDQ